MNSKSRLGNATNRFFLFIVLSTSLALLACGGGGNGGGGNSPQSLNACFATSAGQTLVGKLPGSGSYSAGGTAPAKGSVTIDSAGNFIYTPRAGLRGMDTFSFRVGSSEATATILIDGKVRIMPLGDSITAGVSGEGTPNEVPLAQQVGYRRKLFNDLEGLSSSYGIDFVGSQNSQGTAANPPLADRDHEGQPGACDDNNPDCIIGGVRKPALDQAVTGFLNNNPPDIILLHIGTNQFNTDNSGVNNILNNISIWTQSNYPVSVFLARIIPARDGSLDVTTFNNNVQAIAGNRSGVRILIVDQQSALAVANDANRADGALMADNLHPNQAGYERMADRWKGNLTASGVLPQCP